MLCTDSQVTGSRPLLPPALRLKVLMVLSALKRILKKKPQRPWKYIALELPGSKLWRPFGDGHSLEECRRSQWNGTFVCGIWLGESSVGLSKA